MIGSREKSLSDFAWLLRPISPEVRGFCPHERLYSLTVRVLERNTNSPVFGVWSVVSLVLVWLRLAREKVMCLPSPAGGGHGLRRIKHAPIKKAKDRKVRYGNVSSRNYFLAGQTELIHILDGNLGPVRAVGFAPTAST